MTILTDDLLEGFKMAKIFKDCSGPITSLEFSTDGEACLTASTEDESIHLYDAVLGKYVSNPIYISVLKIYR